LIVDYKQKEWLKKISLISICDVYVIIEVILTNHR
jgi:hypothetical protein